MIEESRRDFLRAVARDAAARAMGLRSSPAASPSAASAAQSAPPAFSSSFEEISGLFVTWLKDGRPRGRSGTLAPDATLHALVEKHAVAALLHDPRVPPAAQKEFPRYSPRISVLLLFEEMSGADGLIVGTHGVLAEKGKRTGIVLPEDAEGLGWDGVRLLGQACLRAGLPEESWRTGSVRLGRFEAETF